MKTAVEAIFVGKAHQCNRRFLQMCSHHLIEPVACTPASGWEKRGSHQEYATVTEPESRSRRTILTGKHFWRLNVKTVL